LVQRRERLDHDVRVTLDLALCIQLLGCGKVVLLRIDEETSLHALNRHLYGEARAGLDSAKVGGEDELG